MSTAKEFSINSAFHAFPGIIPQIVVHQSAKMFKFVVLAACVAFAQAGLISTPGVALASGPALGAPLLGRVSVNPTEVNVVKQQVVVDHPEIRYRAVPTVVQTQPIVQTVQVAPAVRTVQVSAPAVQTVQTVRIIIMTHCSFP
ncbi:hypothetical protein Ocin01_13906 [Orchesella cincta]|uniref:Uncharacterized protein n=1 Tax=Orchesella cincta TaxID=48709 RepID=A0A1D2MII5_ORCCI|nr:hypothetical protein Ocin01_13906 [Orchesella cincta]